MQEALKASLKLLIALFKTRRKRALERRFLKPIRGLERYAHASDKVSRITDHQKRQGHVAVRTLSPAKERFSIFLPGSLTMLDYSVLTEDSRCRFIEVQEAERQVGDGRNIRPVILLWDGTESVLIEQLRTFIVETEKFGLKALHNDGAYVRAIYSGPLEKMNSVPTTELVRKLEAASPKSTVETRVPAPEQGFSKTEKAGKGGLIAGMLLLWSLFKFAAVILPLKAVMFITAISIAVLVPIFGVQFSLYSSAPVAQIFVGLYLVFVALAYWRLRKNYLGIQALRLGAFFAFCWLLIISSYLRSADYGLGHADAPEIVSISSAKPVVRKGVPSRTDYNVVLQTSDGSYSKSIRFVRTPPGSNLPSVGTKLRIDTRTGLSGLRYLNKACFLGRSDDTCLNVDLPRF